jgi:hypothetical protein
MKLLDNAYICEEIDSSLPWLHTKLLGSSPHFPLTAEVVQEYEFEDHKVILSNNAPLLHALRTQVGIDTFYLIGLAIEDNNVYMLSELRVSKTDFYFRFIEKACFYEALDCLRYLFTLDMYKPTKCFKIAVTEDSAPQVVRWMLHMRVVDKDWALIMAAKYDSVVAASICLAYRPTTEREALRVAVENESEDVMELLLLRATPPPPPLNEAT